MGGDADSGEEFVYLHREGSGDVPGRSLRPPQPRRRPFLGSPRYFALSVGLGVLCGLIACALLSLARSGTALVWTERSLTWLVMLFVILGGVVGAVAGVGLEAVLRRRR